MFTYFFSYSGRHIWKVTGISSGLDLEVRDSVVLDFCWSEYFSISSSFPPPQWFAHSWDKGNAICMHLYKLLLGSFQLVNLKAVDYVCSLNFVAGNYLHSWLIYHSWMCWLKMQKQGLLQGWNYCPRYSSIFILLYYY